MPCSSLTGSGLPTAITWNCGQTAPPLVIVCRRENDLPLDLTGLLPTNLQLVLKPASGADKIGAGSITILLAREGILQYHFAAADVAQAGQYQLFVLALYGADLAVSAPIPLTLVAH